jgi:hypothetical protein
VRGESHARNHGIGLGLVLLVLWVKAGLEAQWMAAQHQAYAADQKGAARFIPWRM